MQGDPPRQPDGPRVPVAEFLDRGEGGHSAGQLAFMLSLPAADATPRNVAFLWCGGLRSDMRGSKAEFLATFLPGHGCTFLRFDWSGHGESDGSFADHVLSDWLADGQIMLDFLGRQAPGSRIVLIGSSMGAWIASRLAIRPGQRVDGLVLLAPALDFTHRLLEPALPKEAQNALATRGVWMRPSDYGDGDYPITARLIADGRRHLMLDAVIPFSGPVRILQGQADPDVPFAHALAVGQAFASADVETVLVKDGDHRLSRPQDLARLGAMVRGQIEAVAGPAPGPAPGPASGPWATP